MSSLLSSWSGNLPLVSIVTPSYNSFPYIQETVESVQMQDYPHIEHVVIDGGSTDGTVKFLRGQPHLVWVSEPDRGQSHALNKGFQQARGEIIGWLNADDTYQPGAVPTAVGFLLEHEDVDLVYSDLEIIDENSQPIGLTRAQPFDLTTHLYKNHIKQPTVFMRRRVIEELEGVDERLHYVMDREFWLRAGLSFNLQYLQDKVLANFRLCTGTKSFEQTVLFRSEWLQVLENAFSSPSFSLVPQTTRRRALRKNRAAHRLTQMKNAIENRERKTMVFHLTGAITEDWSIILNRGTWYLFSQGLLGSTLNRLRRFE